MTEILPRHYVYGLIAFAFFMTAGVTLISEANDGYNTMDAGEIAAFDERFNKIDDIQGHVTALESGVRNQSTSNWGAFGVLNDLIGGSWNTIKLIWSSFDFMTGAYEGLTDYAGQDADGDDILPAWIPALVITLITVLFVFSIFTLIFQREA